MVYRGQPRSAGLVGISGGPTLVPAWAMPLNEESWLLRLHEVAGQRGEARIELEAGWTARRCGLDGAVERGPPRTSPSVIAFRPYEIVSVRVERERFARTPT